MQSVILMTGASSGFGALTARAPADAGLLGSTWIDRGMEYPVLLACLSFYILFHGAGRHSLDHTLGREH